MPFLDEVKAYNTCLLALLRDGVKVEGGGPAAARRDRGTAPRLVGFKLDRLVIWSIRLFFQKSRLVCQVPRPISTVFFLPGFLVMASRVHYPSAVKTNNKKEARLESMRYVLSSFDYRGKGNSGTTILPDPNIVQRYHRLVKQID